MNDLTRAVKAVVAAGVPVARVEVDKGGKIIIVVGHAGAVELDKPSRNPWDELYGPTSSSMD